ncbi:LCP family protein [Streptomyces sp. NPDC092296]|uniref:LCP family protein n=1 Tax=Streptomyces sp. NPDC092296 TaxID=3366012 RepID=UPI00382EF624
MDPKDPTEGTPAAHRRARTSRRKPKKGAKRFLKPVAIAAGSCVVLSTVSGWLYYEHLNGNIRHGALNTSTVDVPKSKANAFGQTPLNILLIGSDGRGDKRDCALGGACDSGPPHADVEMLLHLSADRSNASVLSIPRDTVVDIPACTDPRTQQSYSAMRAIITASLGNGGPGCVVGAWQQLTHIHIDHYMMVDFGGVVDMADAVGGVPVCVDHNVSDNQAYTDKYGKKHVEGSHLKLKEGTTTIQGVQALEWLRTRHAFEDGTDIGRTHAQHLYMNSLARQMQSKSTLANPLKLNALADQATKSLTVDDDLGSLVSLAQLAREMNKVPTNRLTMATMPFEYIPTDKAHVQPAPDASRVFDMIANDIPLDKNGKPKPTATTSAAPTKAPVDKAAVRIAVRNGGGVTHRAKALSDFLITEGFTGAVVDTDPTPAEVTAIEYPAAQQAQAQAVAAAIGLPAAKLQVSGTADHPTLVIGTDWSSGTDFRATLPKAGALPTTAVSQNAESDKDQCMAVNMQKDRTGHYIYSW